MRAYGICTSFFGSAPREQVIAQLAEAGFTEVELCGDPGHLDDWPADPASLRAALAAAGIRPRAVHSPAAGWNNGAADPATRQASLEIAAGCFPAAAAVGAEVVICHSNAGSEPYSEDVYAESRSRSIDSLAVLARRAAAAEVRVAAENLPARHLPRPGIAVGQLLEMIDGLGDHVGICLDAGHANANGLVAAEEARTAGAKLFAVHLQDSDGKGEDQHLIPGEGSTDWAALRAAFDEIGFTGSCCFEVLSPPEQCAARLAALAELRERWQRT
jgi:sugar phosphate isomerase/epimerase